MKIKRKHCEMTIKNNITKRPEELQGCFVGAIDGVGRKYVKKQPETRDSGAVLVEIGEFSSSW